MKCFASFILKFFFNDRGLMRNYSRNAFFVEFFVEFFFEDIRTG